MKIHGMGINVKDAKFLVPSSRRSYEKKTEKLSSHKDIIPSTIFLLDLIHSKNK